VRQSDHKRTNRERPAIYFLWYYCNI